MSSSCFTKTIRKITQEDLRLNYPCSAKPAKGADFAELDTNLFNPSNCGFCFTLPFGFHSATKKIFIL